MAHKPVNIVVDKKLPVLAEISAPQVDLYLGYLETTGMKRYASIMAGVDPGRMTYLMKNDEALHARQLMAMQGYCELIDQAIHDRAINGVKKGIYFQGERIATEIQYSDTLLLALAKANNPKKYRDHLSVDANVKAGVLVVQASLDPEAWEEKYAGMRVDQAGADNLCAEPDKAPIQDNG